MEYFYQLLDKPKSIRISKFAASNFEFNLNEGLLSSFLGSKKDHKPPLGCEHELLLKQNSQHPKHKYSLSLLNHNINSNTYAIQTDLVFIPNSLQVSRRTFNYNKEKVPSKEMVMFACQNEADLSNQRTIEKIEKMREMKILTAESKKKKDEFLKNNSRVNVSMTSYELGCSSKSYEKGKKNWNKSNITGSQKKIDKYEKPNHCHFIEMEVDVASPANLLQIENKLSDCKSIVCDNVMERARQKLCYETSNSSSSYESCIRSFDKLWVSNKNETTFEKKLQNFIEKNRNRKVKLTIEELKQFKEIIKRKKSEDYAESDKLAPDHQECEEENSEISLSGKPAGICKIRVENEDKYNDLIEKKKLKDKLKTNDSLFVSSNSEMKKNKPGVNLPNKLQNNAKHEKLNKFTARLCNKMENQHPLFGTNYEVSC